MKINVTRTGDLAVSSADGEISFLSNVGQFSIETPRYGFGYENYTYKPSRFYFVDKFIWRRQIHESNQRVKEQLKNEGLLSDNTSKLLDRWGL